MRNELSTVHELEINEEEGTKLRMNHASHSVVFISFSFTLIHAVSFLKPNNNECKEIMNEMKEMKNEGNESTLHSFISLLFIPKDQI